VDAHPDERALPEAEVSTVAGQDVPAGRLRGVEEQGGQQRDVGGGDAERVPEQCDPGQRQQHHREADQATHQRGHPLTLRANSPFGRSSSASTIATNTTSSEAVFSHSTEARLASTPTSTPAASVPSRWPIPPRITTANTIPIHSNGASGIRVL